MRYGFVACESVQSRGRPGAWPIWPEEQAPTRPYEELKNAAPGWGRIPADHYRQRQTTNLHDKETHVIQAERPHHSHSDRRIVRRTRPRSRPTRLGRTHRMPIKFRMAGHQHMVELHRWHRPTPSRRHLRQRPEPPHRLWPLEAHRTSQLRHSINRSLPNPVPMGGRPPLPNQIDAPANPTSGTGANACGHRQRALAHPRAGRTGGEPAAARGPGHAKAAAPLACGTGAC